MVLHVYSSLLSMFIGIFNRNEDAPLLVRNNLLFSSLNRQTGARAANRPHFSSSQPTNHDEFMKVQAELQERDRTVPKKRPSGLKISDFPGFERKPGSAKASVRPHMAPVVGADGQAKIPSLRLFDQQLKEMGSEDK